jgi:hypothetical protein
MGVRVAHKIGNFVTDPIVTINHGIQRTERMMSNAFQLIDFLRVKQVSTWYSKPVGRVLFQILVFLSF